MSPPDTEHPASDGDSAAGGPAWTPARAESRLRSLELFGMRFGLDRMRRMMTALGSPERRYGTVHVLGTNGKTSTTRMTGAILQEHGLRTGTYTSPHLVSWNERLLIEGAELDGEAFAEAVARASWAADRVNRTLAEDDHVTQFELLTAAALWQMAEHEVQVAVVEAGLGGRYDATSVIDAPITVLTNVGLEHTRWLGPTITDIAEEKLAVVAAGGTLVLGREPGRGRARRRRAGRARARGHRRARPARCGCAGSAPRPRRVPATELRARARRRPRASARRRDRAGRAGAWRAPAGGPRCPAAWS